MPRKHLTNPEHPDPTGGRIFPIFEMTADALRNIPIDSEVVIFHPDGTVEDGDWSEEESVRLIALVALMSASERADYFIIYLPPLVTPAVAVARALESTGHPTMERLFWELQSGDLTVRDFTAILNDVASEAQKEVMA